MPKGSPTIVDVARLAGLSKSLVSRVLLDQRPFSDEARERIMQAADQLGYTRNLQARSLATGSTGVVGVLARRITGEFYSTLVSELQAFADAVEHRIVCVTGNLDEQQERRALETLLSLGVDGVIIGSGRLASEHIAAIAERVPAVVIGRDAPGAHADVVRPDAQQMAGVLAERAAAHGHNRATLLTFAETLSAAPGTEAIIAAFEAKGIVVDAVPGHYDYEPSTGIVRDLLQRDALSRLIVALGGGAAFGAHNVLTEGGIQVPRATSILTYDVGVPDERLTPALSGTAQDITAMAENAWQLLRERMQDPGLEPRLRLVPGIAVDGQTITFAS